MIKQTTYNHRSNMEMKRNSEMFQTVLLSRSTKDCLYYITSIIISTIVVIGVMQINAGDPKYRPDQDSCTCACFDRRFKGDHFEEKSQYK